MGAALLQRDDINRLVPIEFASGLLSDTQARYTTTEQEALAVDFGLKKFRYHIYGYEINIMTDHRPLLSILNSKKLDDYSPRMVRLILRVQSYNPKVIFVKGKDNQLADFLSRLGNLRPSDEVSLVGKVNNDATELIQLFSFDDLKTHQREDDWVKEIMTKLKNNDNLEKDKAMSDKCYVIVDDVLYVKDTDRSGNPRYRVCIPESLAQNVLQCLHHSYPFVHMSADKTKTHINARFFIKNLSNKVRDFINNCEVCHRFKGRPSPPTPFGKYPVPTVPFSQLHFDLMGPLKATADQNKYIIVFVDYTTRYVILDALPNRQAGNVAKVLFSRVFVPFSAPRALVSDNALEFVSSVIKELCSLYKVNKMEVTPRTPHANGVVERLNKTIVAILKTLINESQTDWDRHLFLTAAAINASYHQSLGDTPFFTLFGFDKRIPLDNLLYDDVLQYDADNVPIGLFKLHQRALKITYDHLQAAQLNYLGQSVRRTKNRDVVIGDRVFILAVRPEGFSKKLYPTWTGPYRVLKTLPND